MAWELTATMVESRWDPLCSLTFMCYSYIFFDNTHFMFLAANIHHDALLL